ncbi:MAG: hypothetical protein JWO50_489 [Candidatus Kaiserbacteria bacterium]|nr:hypothetical protein [Candidatus Kaiserbacteria bacterium]
MKRYTAIYNKPGNNPFRGRGPIQLSDTVDIDKDIPFDEVEQWARNAATDGCIFIELKAL